MIKYLCYFIIYRFSNQRKARNKLFEMVSKQQSNAAQPVKQPAWSGYRFIRYQNHPPPNQHIDSNLLSKEGWQAPKEKVDPSWFPNAYGSATNTHVFYNQQRNLSTVNMSTTNLQTPKRQVDPNFPNAYGSAANTHMFYNQHGKLSTVNMSTTNLLTPKEQVDPKLPNAYGSAANVFYNQHGNLSSVNMSTTNLQTPKGQIDPKFPNAYDSASNSHVFYNQHGTLSTINMSKPNFQITKYKSAKSESKEKFQVKPNTLVGKIESIKALGSKSLPKDNKHMNDNKRTNDNKQPKKYNTNNNGFICQFCGYEPQTKNKWQDREDHWVRIHFKDELNKLFPGKNVWKPYYPDTCPLDGCGYKGRTKQTLMRHYTRKHIVPKALTGQGLPNDCLGSKSNQIGNAIENSDDTVVIK